MVECVICHRSNVKFTNEHVIPEALGGYYQRKKMVCVGCNSILGHSVDDALVNHGLSKMFRFVHRLRGKAKSPPNPFVGKHSLASAADRKVRIEIGPDGRLIPYLITQVRRDELDDGRVGVNISVDATDVQKIEPMVRKIAKRLGGSAEESLASAKRKVVHSDSEVHVKLALDAHDYKIGLLKIAYEFAIDRIASFRGSGDAMEISRILREARFDEVERYVNIGDGFDRRIMLPFSDFLGYEGVKHYLVLFASGSGVLCFIHLHNLFCVGVTLSTESFAGLIEIGVNDVDECSFRIWQLGEIPVSTRYRPLLHFGTESEAAKFKQAERTREFEDGMWKLFTGDGRYIGKDIKGIVDTLSPIRSPIVSGGLAEEYWLDEEVYLRQYGSSNGVRVLAIRAEHCWEKL